jgi:hypothetical protein
MSETISASAFSGVAHVQHITVAADTMTTTESPVKMPPGDTVHATARLSCAPDKRFSWPPPANLTLFVLFAVGTTITGRPPHRSGQAQLRHPAPTKGI